MNSIRATHLTFVWALWAVFIVSILSQGQTVERRGQRFNRCLSAIAPESLETRAFELIAEELRRVPEYRESKWNVNRRYRTEAINLIIPKWDNSFWPGSVCGGLSVEPAACAAYPKEKAIVCNPAIGRQLSAPLVQSRIASTQEDFALNFILLTVFGHELGHIRIGGDSAVQHLLRIQSRDGTKCYTRPEEKGPTTEETADEIGLNIACTALRNRPDRKELPTDPGDVLLLLSRVEDNLDDAYFSIDDLCTGDAQYPSVSRRKIRFANRYLNCLYPTGYEPLKLLNESLASDFNDLEKWLTTRQVSGHAADGNYGTRALANQLVARTPSPDVSVAFDSTDTDSSLWFITAQPNSTLSFVQAKTWDRTGAAFTADLSPNAARFLLFLNPKADTVSPSLVEVTVHCDGTKCAAGTSLTDLLPDSILLPSFERSYALVTRTGIQFFASEDQLLSSRGSFKLQSHGFNTGPDTLVVAADKEGGMVATRQAGGLYKVALLAAGSFVSKVLVTVPHNTGTLESAAVVYNRLLLVFSESPELGPTAVTLWDCPYDSIRLGLETVSCTTYQAPEAVETPAALASHNVSSFSDRFIDSALACGDLVVIHHGGWLWLLDRNRQMTDLLFADGIVSCSAGGDTIETYRARRVDTLRLQMRKIEPSVVPLSIITPAPEASRP
jgi:hypothetical protein